MIAEWTHLFPSRTQKLSTSAATIAGLASVKIALRRSFLPLIEAFFIFRQQSHSLPLRRIVFAFYCFLLLFWDKQEVDRQFVTIEASSPFFCDFYLIIFRFSVQYNRL